MALALFIRKSPLNNVKSLGVEQTAVGWEHSADAGELCTSWLRLLTSLGYNFLISKKLRDE